MRGLHIEQRGRDDQELRRARQIRRSLHEGDELVGHLGERDLGDIELLASDQRQKKVEGAFEDRERDREKVKLPLNLEAVRPRRHGR